MEGRSCFCGAPVPYERARACPACSRTASKRYRERHKAAEQRRYRERLPLRSPLEGAVRSARAYLAEYVRRGKVPTGPCAVCGSEDVLPVQPWPAQPLLHEWACRRHRPVVEAEILAGDREPIGDPRKVAYRSRRDPAPAAAAAPAPSIVTRANVEEYLAQLAPDVAAAIRKRASRVGPITVEATAPMYVMQLVRYVAQAIAEEGA